jgi:hypothetical protein
MLGTFAPQPILQSSKAGFTLLYSPQLYDEIADPRQKLYFSLRTSL